MGWLWGNKENAPYGIAGLTILVCFGFLGVTMIFPPEDPERADQIISMLLSLVTLSLGYVFGYFTRR